MEIHIYILLEVPLDITRFFSLQCCMAQKKRKVVAKKPSAKSHPKSSVGMSSFQRKAILTFSLFVFMLYGLTQVNVTSPILAQSSVLGEDDEHKEEEKREEKKEEKREERREEKKPEFRKVEDRKVPPKQVNEIEQRQRENRIQKTQQPVNNLRNREDNQLAPEREFEKREDAEQEDENEIESEFEVQEKKREIIKRNEVEIRTQDGQKIKTKVEDDGSKKIEIEGKDFKLKYELHNGKFEARAEDENGESIDIPEDASDELEDSLEAELEEEGIEVDSSSDQPSIMKNGVRARSEFPIAINPVTKVLTVTTPNGEKEVAVLPDEAMRQLKESGVLDEFEAPKDGTASEETELVTRNNKMAYKIKGKKRHRMLGFIPVNTNVTSYVSAETGEPLDKEQSLLTSVVESISF